ncbi:MULTISPECIES: DUF2500 domain-containing protein [Paenibacillus]|uniref:DUF2500 domain-containing protein n=2 Tax=Paenibacillus TaxID=44249 RepID=A0AAP5LRB8_PAEAM|nr:MULTISPECIES: DUF2500 domain-containing protein [Paenibacillus]MCG7379663.1 DUF2500 domain-containing protein [Paenibacillus sp. ACRSA]MDQ0171444.1 hypothetical protein [Paenibacillus tundrae]MDR6724264.1 hypothetical protein [Paenibacillus amylolyticus]
MGIESSWMFDLFGTVFPIVFVLIIGIVLLSVGKEVWRWGRNNTEPLLTVPSRITGRRMQVSQSHAESGSSARTLYYVTFEVESGDRLEFKVRGEEYGLCSEGDEGRLSFKGTRYVGFERNNRRYTERVHG